VTGDTECTVGPPCTVTDLRTPGDPSSSPLRDVSAALDDLRLTRPVTILTHQMAWTFKVGKLVVGATMLNTVVIPVVRPWPGQPWEQLAAEVHDVMQSTSTRITEDRVPVLGTQVARLLRSRA
jgi:hypothetical protein